MTKQEQAIRFAQGMRGQYIISQALYLAIESINKRPKRKQEPSNVVDMTFLMKHLFSMYYQVQKAQQEYKTKGERKK